jgi:regulation of enolase protein 1 (concanavalin A-like superfamily)
MNKFKILLGFLLLFNGASFAKAQRLEKMNWLNEPSSWSITPTQQLKIRVPSKSDFWRITHYGFTVDDGPFYYTTFGGEFETKVKVSGNYQTTYDQAGIMLRINAEHWIKTGIEFVNGKQNISTVVTHKTSDWSVIQLEQAPQFIWIKAIRRLDAVEIFYSYDDKNYTMMRTCYLKDNCPVQVGLMAASPDGKGFEVVFDHFRVKRLPDLRRMKWAAKQK